MQIAVVPIVVRELAFVPQDRAAAGILRDRVLPRAHPDGKDTTVYPALCDSYDNVEQPPVYTNTEYLVSFYPFATGGSVLASYTLFNIKVEKNFHEEVLTSFSAWLCGRIDQQNREVCPRRTGLCKEKRSHSSSTHRGKRVGSRSKPGIRS